MQQRTLGQLLINDALPEDLRDYDRQLDGGTIKKLLGEVAERHPDKYRDVAQQLSDIGWRAAQESGGYTFGLQHLRKSVAAKALQAALGQKVQALLDDDSLDDKRREEEIVKLVGTEQPKQQKQVYDEALAAKNPLAMQVRSKARGNPMNLSSLLGGDLLYADHRDQVIPVPVTSSYSEGLRPWEYWAGTYGARKGVIDLKFATQDAGFLSKQLNQVAHRLVIEDLDGPEPEGDDAGERPALRGMPVDVDDPDNEGALLAHDVGPYRRNTVLTPKVLKHIKSIGGNRILVRSPTVGGTPHGGVYSRDVGVREHGTLPGRGELPGLAAVQALSEPLTQAQISSKHTGGVAGEGRAISGFDYVNQLVQVPKRFAGGAAHAEVDGIVSRIEPGPAGGNFVVVNGERHFAPEGAGVRVKVGDSVEAGDVLSDGLPNPAKVVEHKGVGEGRRYFVKAFRDAMGNAGMPAHRRNVELLARGLINHVRLTDELGDYVPDDVVPYSTLEHVYQPRKDAVRVDPSAARGKYLERPVLHYSIGTQVRPSVMKDLQHFGVKQVHVHEQPPPFKAEMIRGMDSLAKDPDWMTRMYGSGLKGSLLRGVHRGATSDEHGTSFVPGLAKAVDFGREGLVKKPEPGWKPEPPAAIKWGADVPDGTAMAAGVNPATSPKVQPGGIKPLTGGAASPRPSPAPQPQPRQQQPPTQEPEPQRPLWYGSYQPSNGTAQQLAQHMLPYASKLGPLAPLATIAGVDFNGLGTLTRGKDWTHDDALTKTPPAQPAAAAVPAPPPQQAPNWWQSRQFPSAQEPAQVQPAPAQPAAPIAAGPTWRDYASLVPSVYKAVNTAPVSKEQPLTDVYGRGMLNYGGLQAGNWGLQQLAKVPGVRSLPGAALPGQLARNAFRPVNRFLAPRLLPGTGFRAGAGNFVAGQTIIDSALGFGDAMIAGGGNPIKGYDATTNAQLNKGLDDFQVGEDSTLAMPGFSFDAPTQFTSMGKHLGRMSDVDQDWWKPLGVGGERAFGDGQFDADAAGRKLDAGTKTIETKVEPSGRTWLVDKTTGRQFQPNEQWLSQNLPPEEQSRIARTILAERPDLFRNMFSDNRYSAAAGAGQQPTPDVVAAQQERMRQVAERYGL